VVIVTAVLIVLIATGQDWRVATGPSSLVALALIGWRLYFRTNFAGAFSRPTSMSDVDLRNADLNGADFDGARLRNVNAGGADLRGSRFIGALRHRVDLQRADIRYGTAGAGAPHMRLHCPGGVSSSSAP
jgi:hypothetical protein